MVEIREELLMDLTISIPKLCINLIVIEAYKGFGLHLADNG